MSLTAKRHIDHIYIKLTPDSWESLKELIKSTDDPYYLYIAVEAAKLSREDNTFTQYYDAQPDAT